jgi:tripartite ATP-independent transporter DctM subunit
MTTGLYTLLGVFIIAGLLGAPLGFSMLAAGFAYLIATGQDIGLVTDQTMNGLYNSYLLLAIPLFIFVANIMSASGVIQRLLACGAAMVGHLPGGLAQVNVVSNLIFSGMSGSAVADASGPGLIVARMMASNGRYPRGFAAAISVVSATLGPLMPTSIPMIFYALIANESVGAMLLGGLIPAALLAATLMIAVALIAHRRQFPREPKTPWRARPAILARALPPLALPALLLGLIYSGITTPTEAAAIAAAYALALAFLVYRSMTWRALLPAITATVRATAMIATIMAGAFVFNYAVANEGVPQIIQAILLSWNLSATGFLLCVNLLMLLLAIMLDEVTILLVIVPLLIPIAQALGINLVHFGIVVVLKMMVGLTLPPHGLLLFVMSGLTGTPLGEIFREVPPFIAAMLLVVLAITFFPDIALWIPDHAGFQRAATGAAR